MPTRLIARCRCAQHQSLQPTWNQPGSNEVLKQRLGRIARPVRDTMLIEDDLHCAFDGAASLMDCLFTSLARPLPQFRTSRVELAADSASESPVVNRRERRLQQFRLDHGITDPLEAAGVGELPGGAAIAADPGYPLGCVIALSGEAYRFLNRQPEVRLRHVEKECAGAGLVRVDTSPEIHGELSFGRSLTDGAVQHERDRSAMHLANRSVVIVDGAEAIPKQRHDNLLMIEIGYVVHDGNDQSARASVKSRGGA
jgi:hypothetical protein